MILLIHIALEGLPFGRIATLVSFYKNSSYKNIKAQIAEKLRTSLRTLKALKFSKINVLAKFFKKSSKFFKNLLEKVYF